MPTTTDRWTLPTRAALPAVTAPRAPRRLVPGAPGFPEVELLDEVPDAEPLPLYPCDHCHSPRVPAEMLVDLAPLSPALRAQIGVRERERWLCTGCLGTAHNLGLISHAELLAAYRAPAAARALAEAHTLEFPYRQGSRAHADQHALADHLPPQSPASLPAPVVP